MSICATARIISPALLLCVALAGCGKKDFDQEYADKQKALTAEQAALQKELDRRMTEKPGLESESAAASETPVR